MRTKKIHFLRTTVTIFVISFVLGRLLIAQESEGPRGAWFERDRAYPDSVISSDGILDALEHQETMISTNGYYLNGYYQGIQRMWRSIGPTPVEGPTTGRVVSVKFYPNVNGFTQHPDWLYIAGHIGGVWKSENAQDPAASVSFSPITDNLKFLSSGCMAFDPANPNIIYYGTGGNLYNFAYNYYGIGIYKSTDAGVSWNGPFRAGLPPLPNLMFSFKIAVNPRNHNEVYLANGADPFYSNQQQGGLYKSVDGGITWSLAPGTSYGACNDVVIFYDGETGSNKIFAAGMGNFGYYISNNGGASFTRIHNNFDLARRSQLAIPNPLSDRIYGACIFDHYPGPTDPGGVYSLVSIDGGATYTTRFLYNDPSHFGPLMASTMFFVQSSPSDPLVAFIGFGTAVSFGLFRTLDGGTTWTSVGSPGADKNNLEFNPYPGHENQIILCDDQGLYRSEDLGTTWTSGNLNSTLSFTESYRIASDMSSPENLVIGVEDASLHTRLSGTAWRDAGYGCDGTNVISSRYVPRVFLGSLGYQYYCTNNLLFSETGGTSWSQRGVSGGMWDGNMDWIAALAEYPVGTPNQTLATFYHARRDQMNPDNYVNIYVTTNSGNSWSQPNPTPISHIPTLGITASPQTITFSERNPNIIYVSTKNWNVSNNASRLFKSVDGGATWPELPIHNNGIPNRIITSVVTDPRNTNVVYMTLSGFNNWGLGDEGHIFKSINGGNSWSNISNIPDDPWGFPNLPVNSMLVRYISQTKKELFIATDAGVYTAWDAEFPPIPAGYEWQVLADRLPNTISMGLDYNMMADISMPQAVPQLLSLPNPVPGAGLNFKVRDTES